LTGAPRPGFVPFVVGEDAVQPAQDEHNHTVPTATSRQLGSQHRREEIVQLATTSGLASVDELATRFEVTASTIRRDLALLTADGRLARTYGGAMALVAHPESSLRQRIGEAYTAKQAIARWAASQVQAGETVLLDAGSTVGALAYELRRTRPLTVATTGLTTLEVLADVADVHVECLGGTLRHLSQGFVGPLTEAALERFSFDRAFLGADGVTADGGICEAGLEQTRLKELMARRADKVYVLAHAAKLGRRPFHAWAQLPGGWTLVTDNSVAPGAVAPFAAAGIEVVVVDPAGSPEQV
jgi:DeoR/GlpR family transcriptional regulator of sugar metabolism